MTQVTKAKNSKITEEMERVAEKEDVEVEFIRKGLAEGTIVIPANKNHDHLDPNGFGKGLSTKVNANFGTSEDYQDIEQELKKLDAAFEAGADAVMDLSTGDKISETRQRILEASNLPVGTVPLYQATVEILKQGDAIVDLTVEDFFDVIEKQA